MTKNEKIQILIEGVLSQGITDTGDGGMGGCCPYCFTDCAWYDSITDIKHDDDCVVVIAEELSYTTTNE
mgnify:CR=1 FL=1